MKPSIEVKLQNIATRYDEVKQLLSDHQITNDLNRYRELSKEYAQLEPLAQAFQRYQRYLQHLVEANALLAEEDVEL